MKKNILILLTLIVFGIFFAFIISLIIDKTLGTFLNRTGYFKALTPSVTEVYDTREYSVVATISAQGIRNDIVGPKKKNTYRILAIGDSFTYGWAVDLNQSWVKKLESKLRAQEKHIEVINAGAPGIGTNTEVQICQAYADQFDVDAVILGFYSTDDLYQNAAGDLFEQMDHNYINNIWPNLTSLSSPIILDSWHGKAKPGDRIQINSIWGKLSRQFFLTHPDSIHNIDPAIRGDLLAGKLNSDLIVYAADEPEYLIKMLDPENLDFALKTTDIALRHLKDNCIKTRKGYVVFIPSEEIVSKDYLKYRSGTGYKVDPKLLQLDLDPKLSKIANTYGLKYISLLKDFRKDGCPGCYYNWDIHLSPIGNDRVANTVFTHL